MELLSTHVFSFLKIYKFHFHERFLYRQKSFCFKSFKFEWSIHRAHYTDGLSRHTWRQSSIYDCSRDRSACPRSILSCPSCRVYSSSTCRAQSTVDPARFDGIGTCAPFESPFGPTRQNRPFLGRWPAWERSSSSRMRSTCRVGRIRFASWHVYTRQVRRYRQDHRNRTSPIPILTWCKCVAYRPIDRHIHIYYL